VIALNEKRAVSNQIGIFNMLKSAKEANRLSHAYLFYGEEGTGKKEMAYALACLLYCPNGGCLECETCKTILEGNHMNVDYIGIQEKKTMISKEQITDLQDEFSKTSLVTGTRVYIVDGIDTASSAAQNSLLKFIEDPLNQTPTVGIFLATELSNVVNTIQSRCILEHFPSLSKDKEIEMLVSDGIDPLDAALASILTNNPEEATELTKTDDYIAVKELFLEFIKLKNEKQGVLYFTKYVNVFQDAKRMNMLLSWVLQFLEDSLFHKDDPLLSPLGSQIVDYSTKNKDKIENKMENILNLSQQMRYNVLPKNIFHSLILKFI
jgi:DNA polymerase-3 subunit delta'